MSATFNLLRPGDGNFLFTSESVCEGHPDKLCDQVSDAILDACLRDDPDSKVACEVATKNNMVILLGEISTNAKIDYVSIVRDVVKRIGFDDVSKGLDYKTMKVHVQIDKQSAEIADAVHVGKSLQDLGSGDQGLMFGYACTETPDLMPLSHSLATQLSLRLSQLRYTEELPYLRPDGKTQVTVEYCRKTNMPVRVHTVLISAQHNPEVVPSVLESDIIDKCIKHVIAKKYLDQKTRFLINPSGSFVMGGPTGDAGLTGRKIIVDTYGGWGAHGGGAFSGKDASKVDRSAAYAARWVAKSLVANGFCRKVLVQFAYSIGVALPLSMAIETYGTLVDGVCESDLNEIVWRNFDMRPGCIIRDLQLRKPIFLQTAVGGHFGRRAETFLWEKPKNLQHEASKFNLDLNDMFTFFTQPSKEKHQDIETGAKGTAKVFA